MTLLAAHTICVEQFGAPCVSWSLQFSPQPLTEPLLILELTALLPVSPLLLPPVWLQHLGQLWPLLTACPLLVARDEPCRAVDPAQSIAVVDAAPAAAALLVLLWPVALLTEAAGEVRDCFQSCAARLKAALEAAVCLLSLPTTAAAMLVDAWPLQLSTQLHRPLPFEALLLQLPVLSWFPEGHSAGLPAAALLPAASLAAVSFGYAVVKAPGHGFAAMPECTSQRQVPKHYPRSIIMPHDPESAAQVTALF